MVFSFLSLSSFCRSIGECACQGCRPLHSQRLLCHTSLASLPHHTAMKQFSAEAKHHILLEYRPHSPTHAFAALAAAHGVAGGAGVVRHWHDRWDGTPQSLHHRPVSGRPRALSKREVQQHVRGPLLRANREHRAVHYPTVHTALQANTGKRVSLSTVRRYGHEELGAKQRKGKKRTADECECAHIRVRE